MIMKYKMMINLANTNIQPLRANINEIIFDKNVSERFYTTVLSNAYQQLFLIRMPAFLAACFIN